MRHGHEVDEISSTGRGKVLTLLFDLPIRPFAPGLGYHGAAGTRVAEYVQVCNTEILNPHNRRYRSARAVRLQSLNLRERYRLTSPAQVG